jgi:hypothetical protein
MNTNTPSREDVARRAEEIWKAEGCPGGRDTEFWFEAERQLSATNSATPSPAGTSEDRGNGNSQPSDSGSATTPADPKTPTAAEAKPSPIPHQAEDQSAQQKKSARAPKSPTKSAPKAAPAETGKPLWKKPHSS